MPHMHDRPTLAAPMRQQPFHIVFGLRVVSRPRVFGQHAALHVDKDQSGVAMHSNSRGTQISRPIQACHKAIFAQVKNMPI